MEEKETYIFVCTGKSCKKAGSKQIEKALKTEIKRRRLKTKLTIVKTKCLDRCDHSPNIIVNNNMYAEVSETTALTVLKEAAHADDKSK